MHKSYRGQAGHAAIVASRIDADLKARLKAVNLHDKNLFDLYDRWQTIAKELGAAEDERARLEPQPSSAADLNNARLGWIRIMNAMLANAELAGLDEDADRLIFGALRAAERAAESRGKGKAAATEPTATAPSAPAATPTAP